MRTRVPFRPRAIPGGDAAAFVSARFKGSAHEDVWPCVGTAVLEVSARTIAPYLPADAELEPLGPDRCRLTRGSWSWEGLAAAFAASAADYTVEGPEELRTATAALAERLRGSIPR
jgi:hypothetical protein